MKLQAKYVQMHFPGFRPFQQFLELGGGGTCKEMNKTRNVFVFFQVKIFSKLNCRVYKACTFSFWQNLFIFFFYLKLKKQNPWIRANLAVSASGLIGVAAHCGPRLEEPLIKLKWRYKNRRDLLIFRFNGGTFEFEII